MKKLVLWLTVGVVIVGGVWFLWGRPKESAGGGNPVAARGTRGPAGPVKARAVVVRPAPFSERLTLTGTVLANESVELRPETSGRVVKIGFVEGGSVTTGQLLLKLDDAELVARKAKLQRQLVLDTDRRDRLRTLKAIDGASQEDLDVATAQVDVRLAEIAEVDAALRKTEIRAPFAGRVGLRGVSLGASVSPATLITTLSDDASLKLECSVPERLVSSLHSGSRFDVSVRSRNGEVRRTASVYAVDPAVDPTTRTVRLRARIEKPGPDVRPGMFADVDIELERIPDAILVPSEAVTQDMSGATVVVSENGKAAIRNVVVGGRTTTDVRIVSGVSIGDTVLTSGLLSVKRGMPLALEVQ